MSDYRLIVRRGPNPNQLYTITNDVTNVGRDASNDIVINDFEVSRHHFRLVRSASSLSLEELGSTNGTSVNGKPVTGTVELRNGDMISMGETITLQVGILY